MPTTTTDYAQTAQETTLKTIRQGQQAIVEGVQGLGERLREGDPRDPRTPLLRRAAEGRRDRAVELQVRRAAPEGPARVRREHPRRRRTGARKARREDRRQRPKTLTDPWQQQVEAFGQFLHGQRKLAQLSLRELAARTKISNAYLSQLERGLHAPSVRVLKSLADALELSAETLLEQAGLLDDAAPGTAADAEAAIKADPRLTNAQKEALLAVYRGFTADAEK